MVEVLGSELELGTHNQGDMNTTDADCGLE